ncbi:ferredoxin [Streptomyces enissocaesilis]|uniref:4Fe-4S ferredoxin-type domain-containing protein n=1 Tax=Streptomyces enissocaesilis TaxID=332589 RepID=A0ABN3XNX3_9ACTN
MKIVVNWDRCQGIGVCESVSPDRFEVDQDGQLVVKSETVSEGQEKEAREAVASCPNEALSLES